MPDDSSLQIPGLMDLATPNELANRRALARGLIEQGMGPIQGPAVSPFQAIGGLLNAYRGNQILNQSAQQERQGYAARGAATPTWSGMGGDLGGGPLGVQPPADPSASGYSDGVSKLIPAIAGQEGTGSYSQQGPLTKDGDRAYGKYQVMGKNIGPWSQEVLGTPMTPEQFLQNPQAQEAIARTKLTQYAQQYGPEGAAKAWFAGPQGMNNPDAQAHTPGGQPFGPTVAQYGANAAAAMNGGGTPQVQPASAPGAGPLAFRPPAPGGVPTPNMTPNMGVPTGGLPRPGMFPIRPQMTDQQLRSLMANPYVPEFAKEQAQAMYYSQNQPVAIPGPFHSQFIRSQNGQVGVVPGGEMISKTLTGPGGAGITEQSPYLYGIQGMPSVTPQIQQLPVQPPGPQSMAAPPQGTPASAPGGGPPIPAAITASAAAPQAQPGGIQLASAGTSDLPLPGLGTPPPQPAAGTPPLQLAQAGAAPAGGSATGISSDDMQTMKALTNMGLQYQHDVEGAKGAAESAQKFADTQSDQAVIRAGEMSGLHQLSELLASPAVMQGFGADFRLNLAKAWSYLTGSPYASTAAAQTDLVEKLTKDFNLDALKARLGGLGQIRVFEGNMINVAFANRANMPLANQFLVRYATLTNQRAIDAANRIDADRNPVTGAVDPFVRQKLTNFYANTDVMPVGEQLQWGQKLGIKPTKDILERAKSEGVDTTPFEGTQEGGPLATPPPGAAPPSQALPPGYRLKGAPSGQ